MKEIIKKTLRSNKYIEMLAYILQNNQILNSSGSGDFGDRLDDIYEHNIKVAKAYKKNYNGNLNNTTILEIGTGYTRIAMLYMLKEYGVSKIYTYDRFNCLQPMEKILIEKYNLDIYLDKLEYFTGTNDKISTKLQKASIDYIVSNAVLEHVDNLDLLFENLNYVLKKNSFMYHKVDLRCHNRFKNFGELYFHTFSNKLWNIMGNNIGQPNRKLLEDYFNLFNIFNLDYEMKIIEEFTIEELNKAKNYLKNKNINKYNVSIVEFKLWKKF